MAQLTVNMDNFIALSRRNATLEAELRNAQDQLATANKGATHFINLLGAQSAATQAAEVARLKEDVINLQQDNARLRDQLTVPSIDRIQCLENVKGWDLKSSSEGLPTTATTSVSLLDNDEGLRRYNEKAPANFKAACPQSGHATSPQTPIGEEADLLGGFHPSPPPPIEASPEPVEQDLGIFDFGVKGNLQPLSRFQGFRNNHKHLDDPFVDRLTGACIPAGPRRQFQPRRLGREQSDREYRALLGAATFIEDEVEGMTDDEVQEYWTRKSKQNRGPFASGALLRDFYEGTVRPRYLQKLRNEGIRKAAEDASRKKEEAGLAAVEGGGGRVGEEEQEQEQEEKQEQEPKDDEADDLLGDGDDDSSSDRDHWAIGDAQADNVLDASVPEHMRMVCIGRGTVDINGWRREGTEGAVVGDDIDDAQSHNSSHGHYPNITAATTYIPAGAVTGEVAGVVATVRPVQSRAASQALETGSDNGAPAATEAPRVPKQVGSNDATDKLPEEPEIQVGESALSEALFVQDAQKEQEDEQKKQEKKEAEDDRLPLQGGLGTSKWASAAPPPPHLRPANHGRSLRDTDAQLEEARIFANGITRGGVRGRQREREPHHPRMQFKDHLRYSATGEMTATRMSVRRFDSDYVQQHDVPSRSGPAERELFWQRDSTDSDLMRTVLISGLPKYATLSEIVQLTRALAVYRTCFFDTAGMKTNPAIGNTALMEFVSATDARKFVDRTTECPIIFPIIGDLDLEDPTIIPIPTANVTLLPTPTRPLPAAALHFMTTKSASRAIYIKDPRCQLTRAYVVAKLCSAGTKVSAPMFSSEKSGKTEILLEWAGLCDAVKAWEAIGEVRELGGMEKGFCQGVEDEDRVGKAEQEDLEVEGGDGKAKGDENGK